MPLPARMTTTYCPPGATATSPRPPTSTRTMISPARATDVVNHGVAGTAPTYGTAAPARDLATNIIMHYDYDTAGRLEQVTNNAVIATRRYYDDLGRLTYVVENYHPDHWIKEPDEVDGPDPDSRSADESRITVYTYNSLGQPLTVTALDPDHDGTLADGKDQTTSYVYGVDTTCTVKRKELLLEIESPEHAANGSVTLAYYPNGATRTRTDQRGVILTYYYDEIGRLLLESTQASLPAGVDSVIMSIGRTYDTLGRLVKITSYDEDYTDPDNVLENDAVNEVQYDYDDWGMLATEWQEHGGAVNDDTEGGTDSPCVKYFFDTAVTSNVLDNGLRPTRIDYPNTRRVNYTYGTSGSIAQALSRVDSIHDNVNQDATLDDPHTTYRYLGAATIVGVQHPLAEDGNDTDIGLELTYDVDESLYAGLDRFGRITKMLWQTMEVTPVELDVFGYAYDAGGSRTYREYGLAGGASFDELYDNDDLDRLTNMQRGEVDTSGTPSISNRDYEEDFTLDQVGNWATYKSRDTEIDDNWDLDQARTSNKVNEITVFTGGDWIEPTYDDAGNMTEWPAPNSVTTRFWTVYDAWNRAVEVYVDADDDEIMDNDERIILHEYDGLNRHISKAEYQIPAGTVWHHVDDYYNAAWQLLEMQTTDDTPSTFTTKQFVWDLRYIDSPVLRDRDSDGDGVAGDGGLGMDESGLDERLYYTTDANFNITALFDEADVSAASSAPMRYRYDSYGGARFMKGDWSEWFPQEDNQFLFAGYRRLDMVGLYLARNRWYHPKLGQWMQRDPAGYVDGLNLYQYVRSRPTVGVDPYGLRRDFSRPKQRYHYPPETLSGRVGDISNYPAYNMHVALYAHYMDRDPNRHNVLNIGGPFLRDVRKVTELEQYNGRVFGRLMKNAESMLDEMSLGETDTFVNHSGRLILTELWRTNVRLSLQSFTVFWEAECTIGPKERREYTWCKDNCAFQAPYSCTVSWTLVDRYNFKEWEPEHQKLGQRVFDIRGYWNTDFDWTATICEKGLSYDPPISSAPVVTSCHGGGVGGECGE